MAGIARRLSILPSMPRESTVPMGALNNNTALMPLGLWYPQARQGTYKLSDRATNW